MTVGEKICCTVEKCVYGGDGLARVDGCVLFVPGVLPGERVEVRILQTKRNFCRGALVRVLEPSSDRINPCCRLSSGAQVPGCVYDHADYPAELRMKQGQLEEQLARVSPSPFEFLPPVAAHSPLHYRNRMTLHGAMGKRGPVLGYHAEKSHQVIDLPACPLSSEGINRALNSFRSSPILRRVSPRAMVLFRETAVDGAGWYCSTIPNGTLPRTLTEQTEWGNLKVPVDGFFQVNPSMAQLLVRELCGWFEENSDHHPEIIDLFCGVGGLGLSCMKHGGKRLFGVESGTRSVDMATLNAKEWGIPARFEAVSLGEESFSFADCVGTRSRTTLLVDPPRGGMAKEIAEQIRDSALPRLFYVSCDPATLARDLKILTQGSYTVQRVRLFDLFPRTARFETLVELSAREF